MRARGGPGEGDADGSEYEEQEVVAEKEAGDAGGREPTTHDPLSAARGERARLIFARRRGGLFS